MIKGPLMNLKDSLFMLISKCFRKGVWGWGGGPLMKMKNSLFLLISNDLSKGCGARRGPTSDNEGFLVFADFKCFRKRMCGAGEGAQ